MVTIPKQLQNPEFRFCLIRKQSKIPYEKEWQKLLAKGNQYSYNRADSIRSINNFLEAESKKGNIFFKLDKAGKLGSRNVELAHKLFVLGAQARAKFII